MPVAIHLCFVVPAVPVFAGRSLIDLGGEGGQVDRGEYHGLIGLVNPAANGIVAFNE